jgi:hypothetical protein
MSKLDFKSLNTKLSKYLSSGGMNDINKFLENMPTRAGHTVLIAGGIAWFIGGLAVVYATTVAKDVADIRAELVKSEALKPVVAQLKTNPVPDEEIKAFVDKVDPLYRDVDISALRGKISITSSDGRYFGAFRETVNHAYNGGLRWRLSLESLCVGRECDGAFLSGVFKVNTLSIER